MLIDRPIIVIGCNRSGTTLVFRTLSEHPGTWSYYEESQHVYYRHFPIDPQQGDRIAEPPEPAVEAAIVEELYRDGHNKEALKDLAALSWIPRKAIQRPIGRLYKRPPIRLVEKTPANCLRIPLLATLFPDARFLFVVRRPEPVISSLMEGWKNWSRTPPGEAWSFGKWHYLVPTGWQEWTGRALEEICAFQWEASNRQARDDLEALGPDRFLRVDFEDTLADPHAAYARIRAFCELPPSRHFDRLVDTLGQRVHTHGGSAPQKEKWRRLHGEEVERTRPIWGALAAELYPGGERASPEAS